MITLDGTQYEVYQTAYSHTQTKLGVTKRSLTGALSRVETGVVENLFQLTLLCTTAEIATLRTSYNKTATTGTPPTNQLTFTDEEGVEWNPATGSDDSTHRYSTGVYFETMGTPKPLTPRGWTTGNYFTVAVTLRVNAETI